MLKQHDDEDTPPQCFGDKRLYNSREVECVGGHDPAHYNQNPNSKYFQTQTRDACDWVNQCAARVQAQIIPVSNLTRPHTPAATAASSNWSTKFTQPPTAPTTQPYRPPTATPHMQPGQQYMAVNFGIPQYLSVREPSTANFGARLARETFRSMLKSIGHTFAHFFDVEIFGPPPNDGGSPQGG